MTEFVKLIIDVCDEMEKIVPDWEDCPTCGPVIPWLRKNKDSSAITPTKIRLRSLMRKLKYISPEKYNIYNDRLRRLSV